METARSLVLVLFTQERAKNFSSLVIFKRAIKQKQLALVERAEKIKMLARKFQRALQK